MRAEQFYRGNIFECTSLTIEHYPVEVCSIFGGIETKISYKHKLVKFCAILVKLDNGYYVDIENLNSLLDYLKLYRDCIVVNSNLYSLGLLTTASNFLMSTRQSEGSLFVDKSSLVPYYDGAMKKSISIHSLRKTLKK